MSAHGANHGKCLRTVESTAPCETQLKALAKSMRTSTWSGSSPKVLVHCLVVCTTASHPALVCTPTWARSRMDLTEEPMSSTATLLESPTAAGRRDPSGLRRAMSDAPQIHGRMLRDLTPKHRLDDLRDEAERLIARGMAQSFLEMRRPETTRPCNRRRRETGQILAHHVRVTARTAPGPTSRSLSMASRCASTTSQGTTGGSQVRAVHARRRAS